MAQVKITHVNGSVEILDSLVSGQRIDVQQGDRIEILGAEIKSASVDGNDYVVTLGDAGATTLVVTFENFIQILTDGTAAVGTPAAGGPAPATTLVIGDTVIAGIEQALGQIVTAAGPGPLAPGAVRSGGSREAPEEINFDPFATPDAAKGPLLQDFPSDQFEALDTVDPVEEVAAIIPSNEPPVAEDDTFIPDDVIDPVTGKSVV